MESFAKRKLSKMVYQEPTGAADDFLLFGRGLRYFESKILAIILR